MTVFRPVGLALIALFGGAMTAPSNTPAQAVLGVRSAKVITQDGLRFKDLNANGRLDAYENWRLPAEQRADDLLGQMTLEEKAGLMMHGTPPSADGGLRTVWNMEGLRPLIQQRNIRFFIHRVGGSDPAGLAEMANAAQAMAEDTRLGIPLTLSSDPRNHFQTTFGISIDPGAFSQWPETTGLAATRDPALVRRFATIASAEYRAVGIRMALSPMADLASEPRWPRINGTFGDDPAVVEPMVEAYVEGFQGGDGGLGPESVAAVVKHWVGYGAQPEGFDAHNPYGQTLAFPARAFDQHVAPFRGAFRAHVAGVMPTYGRPDGSLEIDGHPAEQVGAGFSRLMIEELLRGRYGFEGIVLTDWKITDDCLAACQAGTLNIDDVGMPWGVEALDKPERFARALEVGVDQFGGVADTAILVDLVRSGRIPEARIDQSARRLLVQTFRLGLFENPYVDPAAAARIVGAPASRSAALEAQRRSLVLLRNTSDLLPLDAAQSPKVWLWKVSADAARARGFTVVETPAEADVAVVRVAAPFTTRPAFFFGSRHHEGSLQFAPDNADRLAVERASASVPTVVSVYLDRPAILTAIRPLSDALIAEFGASDNALLDLVTGVSSPSGRLPFELPSSMAAVEGQSPDAPSDSLAPLYTRGFGLMGW